MKVGTDAVVLGAWTPVPAGVAQPRILDIGCGCGILTLMLAQRCPDARLTAVEISPEAMADAADNFRASPWADRISAVNADILTCAGHLGRFDLIVCNPPFFTESLHAPDASRATARHEGSFGVDSLIRLAPSLLAPGGSLSFVAPVQRDSEIDLLLGLTRLHTLRSLTMRQREGRPEIRRFRNVGLEPAGPSESSLLTVNNPDGSRTPQYASLTTDFYL